MKRVILSLMLLAGTLVATKSEAQVFVRGGVRFGIPVPVPRVYCAPRVVYAAPYSAPYYGGGVVVAGPAYGCGYGRFYHERRWRHYGRW
jgi:hypothetical protein